MSAIQWSGPGKGARRKGATLDSFLLVLGLLFLATAVVLVATPGETPMIAESGGSKDSARVAAADLSGNDAAFGVLPRLGRAVDDPAYGAWSSAEAEWLVCNGNEFPAPLCSDEPPGATP